MTKWLNTVMREAKRINHEKFMPMDEFGPVDHVINELDEQHKKLYALAQSYKRSAEYAVGKAMNEMFRERSSMELLLKKAMEEEKKADAVMEIFQASVRDKYNLWGEYVVIRKGWKIVRIATDEIPNRAQGTFFNETI